MPKYIGSPLLSYRHSYHVGNFADVLKHVVLVEILSYLIKKDKPFTYIDTHAGAGLYSLTTEHALKTAEFQQGVARLKRENWPELERYFQIIHDVNSTDELSFYPGSPKIAQSFLRDKDQARLFELHSTDFNILRELFAKDKRVFVNKEDGYQGLIALLPPVSRRGLILFDPSYELKTDYEQVLNTLEKAYRRFATGIYAIWYPVVDRYRIDKMENRFVVSDIKRVQLFELSQRADSSGKGMTAAGMIVVNPPWTLMATMQQILPKLACDLGARDKPVFRCRELVSE